MVIPLVLTKNYFLSSDGRKVTSSGGMKLMPNFLKYLYHIKQQILHKAFCFLDFISDNILN